MTVDYNRYFRNNGFMDQLTHCCAVLGEWGSVNTLVRLTRAANVWANSKTGQRLDRSVGEKKLLLDELGERDIEIRSSQIRYTQRGELHRVKGPANIYYIFDTGCRTVCLEWHLHGVMQRMVMMGGGLLVGVWLPKSLFPEANEELSFLDNPNAVFELEARVAEHQLEKSKYVSFETNVAKLKKQLRYEKVESSDEEEELHVADESQLAPGFYSSSYKQLDKLAKQFKRRARARREQKAAAPKRRRLRKRCDSDDEAENETSK